MADVGDEHRPAALPIRDRLASSQSGGGAAARRRRCSCSKPHQPEQCDFKPQVRVASGAVAVWRSLTCGGPVGNVRYGGG